MGKKNSAGGKKPNVSSFLRGTILTDDRVTRQIPFILFLVFLGLLLITNRYRCEKVIREIHVLQDTVDDLKSQSITNSAKLMNMSKPSEVLERVRAAGLKLDEPTRPQQRIVVDKIKEKK